MTPLFPPAPLSPSVAVSSHPARVLVLLIGRVEVEDDLFYELLEFVVALVSGDVDTPFVRHRLAPDSRRRQRYLRGVDIEIRLR